MLGNWATGKLRMVRPPTSTSTMEITMATMGRLIKNFDIGLPSLGFHTKWLGVHLHARTHLLYAFRDHPFARLKSVRNNPLPVDTGADLDRSDAHFVLVVHPRDLIAALPLLKITLRPKQRILLESHSRANLAVPAWTQNISSIRN